MKLATVGNRDTLDSIGVIFENFRNSSGVALPRYPAALKLRALDLVSAGNAVVTVARACGLPNSTVFAWLKSDKEKPVARRLELVDSAPAVSQGDPLCIFRSHCGVVLEASKENAVWILKQLNGGAKC